MRWLIISPVFPLPPDTGTRVRLFHVISKLRDRGHQVGLVSMIHEDQTELVDELAPLLSDLELVIVRRQSEAPLSKPASRGERNRRALTVLGRLASGVPLRVALSYHPRIAEAVARLEPQYDALVVEFFFMAQNLSPHLFRQAREKLALVEHDISFIPQRRRYEVASGWTRCRAWLYYWMWRRVETSTLRRFSRIFAMSEPDRELLSALAPGARITVVPNGVDTAGYAFNPVAASSPPRLLFLGGLQHDPNFDGLEFFIRDILPQARGPFPDLRLTIVGKTNGAEQPLLALPAGSMVRFAGFVPDLNKVFPEYTAMVVPLRIAGGTRLKILEAMAAGLPVISTAIGAEGLPARHGEHLLLAETAPEFIKAIKDLSEKDELRQALVRSARKLVEDRFNWNGVVESMEKSFES